jgi:hypothetical protein
MLKKAARMAPFGASSFEGLLFGYIILKVRQFSPAQPSFVRSAKFS